MSLVVEEKKVTRGVAIHQLAARLIFVKKFKDAAAIIAQLEDPIKQNQQGLRVPTSLSKLAINVLGDTIDDWIFELTAGPAGLIELEHFDFFCMIHGFLIEFHSLDQGNNIRFLKSTIIKIVEQCNQQKDPGLVGRAIDIKSVWCACRLSYLREKPGLTDDEILKLHRLILGE